MEAGKECGPTFSLDSSLTDASTQADACYDLYLIAFQNGECANEYFEINEVNGCRCATSTCTFSSDPNVSLFQEIDAGNIKFIKMMRKL